MKKKILLLIMLLVPFLVSAKEEINYEWMKENSNGFFFLGEEDNQYLVFDVPNNGPRITYYQPNGKKVSSRYLDFDDEEDRKIMIRFKSSLSGRETFYNEVDGEEIILEPYYMELGLYNEETDAYEHVNYLDLSSKDQIKYTGKYHVLFELMAENDGNTEYTFQEKKNCFVVYKTVFANSIRRYIEVYDFEENKLLSKKISNDGVIIADINEYGMYVLEAYYGEDGEIELTKYDLKGKEEYTKDITDLLEENVDLDYDSYYSLVPSALDVVNNGLIISISDNRCVIEKETKSGYNPCLPPEAFIRGVDTTDLLIKDVASPKNNLPIALIKLDIDYEITTKVEGKGTVTAIGRSEANGLVTFKVEPQQGYVLSVVKVTDANGNIIEFRDYTFTMPSSDVLIEAVFVPENPYTADIAIAGIVLVAIVFGVVALKYYKKAKWMN